MGIEFLLWLQDIRMEAGDTVTHFMSLSSKSAEVALIVPVIIYWCINRRAGLFLMFSLYVSYFTSNLVKLTLCLPRPFMIDSRVIQAGELKSSYSFPSGHTVQASAVFGGLAVMTRKKGAWFSCFCMVLILLVGISRNFLGVHTVEDVIAGMAVAFIVLWLVSALREHENILIIGGLILCIAGTAYISLKTYPDDGFTLLERADMKNPPFLGGLSFHNGWEVVLLQAFGGVVSDKSNSLSVVTTVFAPTHVTGTFLNMLPSEMKASRALRTDCAVASVLPYLYDMLIILPFSFLSENTIFVPADIFSSPPSATRQSRYLLPVPVRCISPCLSMVSARL